MAPGTNLVRTANYEDPNIAKILAKIENAVAELKSYIVSTNINDALNLKDFSTPLSHPTINNTIHFLKKLTMKGLDTVESLSAGTMWDPNFLP